MCFTVAGTIGVTNYAASFGAKKCSEATFEAAEMTLGPSNQQIYVVAVHMWRELSDLIDREPVRTVA